jgi:stage II sporulation protein AA (anti-sigma F factor antagonist)
MKFNYNETSRILNISFEGEIDHHSCGEIAVFADDVIKKYLPQKVIFDFENVKFMDSAGIGMILGRYKQLIRFGGKAEIININSDIKRIFNMVGIFKIIPIKECV